MQAGRIKLIAVAAPRRSRAQPDVPTLSEAGGPSMQVGSWLALMAPRGTPPDVVRKINRTSSRARRSRRRGGHSNNFGFDPRPARPSNSRRRSVPTRRSTPMLVKRTGASAD
jgi:hypothetical protein